MAEKKQDIQITPEEFEKIQNAMKQKEFRDLFFEYAKELSDPEKKKEYEQEIISLERERGEDVKFVKPEPGYVLKTVELKGNRKVFINVCGSDLVQKASNKVKTQGKKIGQQWSVPHILVPSREDKDKVGKNCLVFDVAFHPETLTEAYKDHRVKNMLNSIAVEKIEQQYNMELDKKNIKLPKMKYKGVPHSTVVRSKLLQGESLKTSDHETNTLNFPYPPLNETKVEDVPRDNQEETIESGLPRAEAEKTVPKYKLIHRGHFDMQTYTTQRDSRYSTRPQELVLEVELPLASSAAALDLDVFEKQVVLDSNRPKYHLDLTLPFPVKDDQGKASFDKTRKVLTVVLPVVQPRYPGPIKDGLNLVESIDFCTENKEINSQHRSSEEDILMDTSDVDDAKLSSTNIKDGVSSISDNQMPAADLSNVQSLEDSSADNPSVTVESKQKDDSKDAASMPSFPENSSEKNDCKTPAWRIKQRQYELSELGKNFSCSLTDHELASVNEPDNVSSNDDFQKRPDTCCSNGVKVENFDHMDDLPGMFKQPMFLCDQDEEQIKIRILVPNVALEDVSLGITDDKVSVNFPTDAKNPLAADWCLLLQLVDNTSIVADESHFDITPDDVHLTLKKHGSCRQQWDRVLAGSSQKTLKEIFFKPRVDIPPMVVEARSENVCISTVKEEVKNSCPKMEVKLENLLNEQESTLWKLGGDDNIPDNEAEDAHSHDEAEESTNSLKHVVQKDPGLESEFKKTWTQCPVEHRTSWSQGSSEDLSVNVHLDELDDDVILDEMSSHIHGSNHGSRPVTRSQSYDCACPVNDTKIKPILKRCQSLTYEDIRNYAASSSSSLDSVSENGTQERRRHKSVSFDMKLTVHEFIQLSKSQWRRQRKAKKKQEALSTLLSEEKIKHDKIREKLKEVEGNSETIEEVKKTDKVSSVEKNTPQEETPAKINTCSPEAKPPQQKGCAITTQTGKKKNKKKKRHRKGSQTSSEDECHCSEQNGSDRSCDESPYATDNDDKVSDSQLIVTANRTLPVQEVLTNSLMFELEA